MSDAAQLAEQALTALNAQNYQEAINLYTSALETFPAALEYYIKRSTAHQRNAQYNEALRDAEIACMLGKQRGKRESTGNAQLRRAISLYMLEQYGDAGFCFTLAKRYAPNEKSIEMWQKRLEMAMAKLDEEDFRREVTVKEIPEVEIPRNAPKVAEKPAKEKSAPADEVLAPTPPPPEGVVTPRSKIRHEWYQTNTHTVITLYVKGVPKDKATIVIQESSVCIPLPSLKALYTRPPH